MIERAKTPGANNEERFCAIFLNVLKFDLGKVAENAGALDRAPTTKTWRHTVGLNALDSLKISIANRSGERHLSRKKITVTLIRANILTSRQADYVMLRHVM